MPSAVPENVCFAGVKVVAAGVPGFDGEYAFVIALRLAQLPGVEATVRGKRTQSGCVMC